MLLFNSATSWNYQGVLSALVDLLNFSVPGGGAEKIAGLWFLLGEDHYPGRHYDKLTKISKCKFWSDMKTTLYYIIRLNQVTVINEGIFLDLFWNLKRYGHQFQAPFVFHSLVP